ncbi:hypothetical protein CFOL_v3_10258 [Cephalotus follicularis]|uniref:Uncharacterized protein n=1 Tax=Cephalotus follicularis TaxID=3775 RepID=A0A1Q3BFN6_CEPFO|nr:hypothetical protein CFOL_v3_10258 [Cephalotus follicularis]
MSQYPPLFPLLLLFFNIVWPAFCGLPGSEAVAIQQLVTNSTPQATIPAFPEQSDVAGCPLDLPEELFHGIKSACSDIDDITGANGQLNRSKCCPILAAWLYAAYSATALGRASGRMVPAVAGRAPSYDLPLLPDDSETCVSTLGKSLSHRGIELAKPNETCDVVYCFCGIRLHPLSCSDSFSLNQEGKLVGDNSVRRLERDCLSSSGNVPGLSGCSKCLNTLYQLNKEKTLNSSKAEDRTTKMHNKDCQLMGLTWLLAKNRASYIYTVSKVLQAIMLSEDDSNPPSCTLGSDGMPLAIDSSEISHPSSSITHQPPTNVFMVSLCLLYVCLAISTTQFLVLP